MNNWPEILIGAIVGYLIQFIPKVIRYGIRRFKKDLIEGTWFVYFYTNENGEDFKIAHVKWQIKKGFFEKYTVVETRASNAHLVYKGTISTERNFWLISLYAKGHDENVRVRLYNPIPSVNNITYGMSLNLDFDGKILARGVVLAKKELEPEVVRKTIAQKVTVNAELKTLMT